jgi:CubicO group peptidase (beta-lactamase class C family)
VIAWLGFLLAAQADTTPAPDSATLDAERLFTVDYVIERGVTAGGFPGASVAIGRRDGTVWLRGYGARGCADEAHSAVDPTKTIYDLASLTKVIATTTAIMILYDQGRVRLDAPVARYLPSWKIGKRAHVTLRDLLTHRSGLPAGRELWRVPHPRRAVLKTPLEYTPGDHYVYSDLGADVLGFVVEAVAHEPLDAFVSEHVFQKLGMKSTRFRPPKSWHSRLALTEAPLGRVHDRNAAALGGVAGHAGLFSSAADLSIFARMMLNGGRLDGVRIVHESTVALFTRRAAGHRALGWDTCGGASCGQIMDETAYGHTGYTGTSIWIDPSHDMFVILLTNWACGDDTHPLPPWAALADVRADVADIAEAATLDLGPLARPTLTLRSDGERGWHTSSVSMPR